MLTNTVSQDISTTIGYNNSLSYFVSWSAMTKNDDADSSFEMSREDKLKLLQNELIKGEQSGMTDGPVDIDAINAEIDQELQAEQ